MIKKQYSKELKLSQEIKLGDKSSDILYQKITIPF